MGMVWISKSGKSYTLASMVSLDISGGSSEDLSKCDLIADSNVRIRRQPGVSSQLI